MFHGTNNASSVLLCRKAGSVALRFCKANTDFRRGFYTTTNPHRAESWANLKAIRSRSWPATVIQFDLDRAWLATLDTLAFVRATQDFWDLVGYCRTGGRPHNRKKPTVHGAYDVVYGRVTLWPQTLPISDCDQIGFHTARALRTLPSPTVAATGTNGGRLF